MKSLLKLDPKERPTASQALQNPYFDGLRDKNTELINEGKERPSLNQRIKSNYQKNLGIHYL